MLFAVLRCIVSAVRIMALSHFRATAWRGWRPISMRPSVQHEGFGLRERGQRSATLLTRSD
eukprot:8910974-Alexandrium_andersonii.AAC.2